MSAIVIASTMEPNDNKNKVNKYSLFSNSNVTFWSGQYLGLVSKILFFCKVEAA
jgi:hypothetical protein